MLRSTAKGSRSPDLIDGRLIRPFQIALPLKNTYWIRLSEGDLDAAQDRPVIFAGYHSAENAQFVADSPLEQRGFELLVPPLRLGCHLILTEEKGLGHDMDRNTIPC
jgi:hypothetical protein